MDYAKREKKKTTQDVDPQAEKTLAEEQTQEEIVDRSLSLV
jgi:hypothetical protein